ncbi:MAG: DUF427 domain-containing protein [Acidimicrobiales bacterium]
MIAMWNGVIVAHSTDTIRVEGYHYFPPQSVDRSALVPSTTTSRCWWKDKATYYHGRAHDAVNRDAAWTYERPWPLARRITSHVAFWRGVTVEP